MIAKDPILSQLNAEKEELQKSLFELTVYSRILETFSLAFDLDDLANIIIQALGDLVDYNLVAVLFAEPSGGQLTVKARVPLTDEYLANLKTSLVDNYRNMTGEDLDSGKVDLRYPPDYRPAKITGQRSSPIKTFFNIPLTAEGRVRGIITIASARDESFAPQTIKFIHQVARRASGGVDHIQEIVVKSRSYIESMVASMTEGVVIFDPQKSIIVCNKAAQNLLFLPTIPAGPEEIDHILGGRLNAMFAEAAKENVAAQEIQLDTPRLLHLKADLFPVLDNRRHQLGLALILRDITRLKELDRLKSEFVANVSHELRTPLAIIREYVSLIKDGVAGAIQPKQKEFLGTILDNTDRLGKLIDDLLNISKLEAGKVKLSRKFASLSGLLEEIKKEFLPTAEKKDIKLAGEIPAGLPLVFIDPDRIRQVIVNLLGNAVKFTPERGRIKLAAVPDQEHQQLVVKIEDSGPGLTPEEQKMIFNRFQQVGRTYGPGAKGTGLGLAISLELARLHGGSLWVESTAGKGSTFCLSLPVETPPKILVVDDEPDILTALKAVLESEHFYAMTAKSGREALDSIARERPDLITLDIRMPHMDGYQVVEKLKAKRETADIPILILSAYTINVAKLKNAGLEVVESLAKPFNNNVFLGKVMSILEEAQKIKGGDKDAR